MTDFVIRTEVEPDSLYVFARRADGEIKEFRIPHSILAHARKLPRAINEIVDFLVGKERDGLLH